MAITRGQHGPEVEDFQKHLIRLGYDHPRYGADGWAGSETFEEAEQALEELYAVSWDASGDVIPSDLVALIMDTEPVPHPDRPDWPGDWLHDRRLDDPGKQGRARSWEDVTGITLHQTATCFLSSQDPTPEQVAKAISRVKKIKAHAVVLRCGHASLNAPLNVRMAHGHAFNRRDIGIEVDGYFAGVHGDDRTFWKPKSRPNRKPMESSAKQVESCRSLIAWMVQRVASQGGKIKHIHAHRQTHRGKPSDPGQLIWRDVALWAKAEFGLTDGGPDYYVPHHKHKKSGGLSSQAGPGRPIPIEWDPDHIHEYRWKPKA